MITKNKTVKPTQTPITKNIFVVLHHTSSNKDEAKDISNLSSKLSSNYNKPKSIARKKYIVENSTTKTGRAKQSTISWYSQGRGYLHQSIKQHQRQNPQPLSAWITVRSNNGRNYKIIWPRTLQKWLYCNHRREKESKGI